MFRQINIRIVAVLAAALLIAGCGSLPASQNGNDLSQNVVETAEGPLPGTLSNPNPQKTMVITTYQATKDGMYLVPETHTVPQNEHPAQTALELLVAGTKNPELISIVPHGTKVLGVKIKNHIAYADFNSAIVKNNPGGSTEEMLLVAAIVDTLTEFHDIQKVQILVDGKTVDTINGHMDTSEPLSRSEKIIKKQL